MKESRQECRICMYYGDNDCRRRKPYTCAGSHIKKDGRNAGLNDKGHPIIPPSHWCGFFTRKSSGITMNPHFDEIDLVEKALKAAAVGIG